VYIVSRNPSGNTYHQNMPCPKPELLNVWVNTKSTLWCVSGTNARIRTIAATPATCQKTEMLLNSATSGDE
jgi:hypothetical protein